MLFHFPHEKEYQNNERVASTRADFLKLEIEMGIKTETASAYLYRRRIKMLVKKSKWMSMAEYGLENL